MTAAGPHVRRAESHTEYGETKSAVIAAAPSQTGEDTMADFDTPRARKLLPDAIHQAARPGTALLRLETTHVREGILDGAWWPRSRRPRRRASGSDHRTRRVSRPHHARHPDAGAWEDLPTRLIVDDRVVHIDSFPVGDDTVLITRGDRDHFSLLVVPPHATPDAARAAMARAVRADNVTQAEQILIETSTDTAQPSA